MTRTLMSEGIIFKGKKKADSPKKYKFENEEDEVFGVPTAKPAESHLMLRKFIRSETEGATSPLRSGSRKKTFWKEILHK